MDLADRAVQSADFMSHLKDLFFIIIIAIHSCIQKYNLFRGIDQNNYNKIHKSLIYNSDVSVVLINTFC